jgi:integrase
LKYYQVHLEGLEYFAARNEWPETAAITREHHYDFMAYLVSEPHRWAGEGRRCTFKKASPGTVHHYLKVAKTFFNWAMDEGYLEDSPVLRLRLPPANYKDVEPYTDDEVNAMLGLCEHDIQYAYRYLGIRNKAIISVSSTPACGLPSYSKWQ